MFIFIIFYSLYKNNENTFESCFNWLMFFKGKFSYFYTFNTFICILINIKLILTWFDLGPTLKTLNLSLLRFFERFKFENHVYHKYLFA